MPHLTVASRRRHERARSLTPLHPSTRPVVGDPLPLMSVSAQVVIGFLAPLPIIQVGHWLFGWHSVLVMFGGQ